MIYGITPPDPKTQADLDKIDLQLAKSVSDWAAFQVTNALGYQVLWTHRNAPKDGLDAAPDGLNDAPTNMKGSGKTGQAFWSAGKMPSSFSARVRADVYDGPRGRGYVLVVQAVEGASTWQRVINNGPEVYRDQSWNILSNGAI